MASQAVRKEALKALECLGPKVTLQARVKVGRKWSRFNAAYDEHGHVLANVVAMHGEQVEFPICHYELRYTDGDGEHRPSVGDDAAAAEEERKIVAQQLAVKKVGVQTGVLATEQSFVGQAPTNSSHTSQPINSVLTTGGNAKRVTQAEALAEFIEDRELQGKMEMGRVCTLAWEEFVKVNGIAFLDEVNRKSLLRFDKAMRDRGLSPRTQFNRHSDLLTILNFSGLEFEELDLPPAPKFESKLPTVYTSAQLKRLFDEADEYERLAFQMPLKLGLRAQELWYAEFSDINLETGVFRVQGKPRYDFTVKDHEQREIPIPDDLLESIIVWKERHPGQSLIVATESGDPDQRLCARVKALATRAGLNCGYCESCKKIAELRRREAKKEQLRGRGCMQFNLHQFRRTYITALLQSGIDIRTVAAYAGHSNIKTTMRYLRPVSARQNRSIINQIQWEGGLSLGL